MEDQVKYNKILVARRCPENRCFADNGSILILKPKKTSKSRGYVSHHFIDHLDKKIKSKYGWVKEIEPITLEDFVNKYVGETEDIDLIEHTKIMLESIRQLRVDTPVAVTYSERGIENKRMDLTVHRVIFYKETNN